MPKMVTWDGTAWSHTTENDTAVTGPRAVVHRAVGTRLTNTPPDAKYEGLL